MTVVHRMESKQIVPVSRDEAWAFFSNPANLPAITPPDMDFRVTGTSPQRMYPGMIITYRLRPLRGVPATWVTEITQVRDGTMFVDEQRIGPYRMWHHEHWFADAPGGGTEVRDVVYYALPFGILGDIAHAFGVRARIRAIFQYRRRALAVRFGVALATPTPTPAASGSLAPNPA